ncbi:MAG: hypothetical protein IPQ05_22855 [Leptospiraceae bacterium]|nr:hypothetical protein [Leptospiraceae bacterium]
MEILWKTSRATKSLLEVSEGSYEVNQSRRWKRAREVLLQRIYTSNDIDRYKEYIDDVLFRIRKYKTKANQKICKGYVETEVKSVSRRFMKCRDNETNG